MSSFARPPLASVSIPGHTLVGYINVDQNPNSRINLSLVGLEDDDILRVYPRSLCDPASTRKFIYLPSKWLYAATDALTDGVPLRCLNNPLNTSSAKQEQLRYVFDHLLHDWDQAWVGLVDRKDITTATATTTTTTCSSNGSSAAVSFHLEYEM